MMGTLGMKLFTGGSEQHNIARNYGRYTTKQSGGGAVNAIMMMML